MNCKETQRCIRPFLKDELDGHTAQNFVKHVQTCSECMEELTIEYLLLEGISRLENAEDFDLQSELDERLEYVMYRKKIYKQIKAGLFLVASLVFCMIMFD